MSHTREIEEPPDEQSSGQDDAVAQPQDSRVREEIHVERIAAFTERHDDAPPLDFSPASTAIDPSDAKQDLSAGTAMGRFEYTPNATYTDEDLPAQSDAAATLNQFNREQDSNSDEDMESPRRETDLHRDIRGWGKQIGLTDPEIRHAITIVQTTPTGVRRNFGLETVCLGALTIAANKPTHGPHTAKSIRLRGPSTDNAELVENYEQLKGEISVSTSSILKFRAWYNRNHSQ